MYFTRPYPLLRIVHLFSVVGRNAAFICPPPSGLEFERWLNGCGPPLCEPDLSAGGVLTGPVQQLCELWGSDSPDSQAIATFDLTSWSTFQTVLFLDRLLDRSPLSTGTNLSAPCFSSSAPDNDPELNCNLCYALFSSTCDWFSTVSLRGDDPPVMLLLCTIGQHECGGADSLAADRGAEQLLP